jgi:uncharacterized oxidoreductase
VPAGIPHQLGILVTGGTRGLGLALAKSFLRRGHRVAVCGRSAAGAELVRQNNPEIFALQADIGGRQGRANLIADCEALLGRIDILVNNAALCRVHDFLRQGLPADDEIAANFTAPVELCRALLARPPGGRPRAIANISTGGAFLPLTVLPVYSATKAALHSFSQSLRRQLWPLGITVTEVFPPTMDTTLIQEIELSGVQPQNVEAIEGFADRAVSGILAGKNVVIADFMTAATLQLAWIAPRLMTAMANKAVAIRPQTASKS